MKRLFSLILAGLLFLLSFAFSACAKNGAKEAAPTDDPGTAPETSSEEAFALFFTAGSGWHYSETWPIDYTEFLDVESIYYPELSGYPDYIKERITFLDSPASWSEIRTTDKFYMINGVKYAELTKRTASIRYQGAYGWSADKSWYYEYGVAENGFKLYRNLLDPENETLIVVDPEFDGSVSEWSAYQGERLLAKADSVLHHPEEYSIEDFGAASAKGLFCAPASYFAEAFRAHLTGEGMTAIKSKTAAYEVSFYGGVNISLEYKRIPGLRYNFQINAYTEGCEYYEYGGLFQEPIFGNTIYIYSVADRCWRTFPEELSAPLLRVFDCILEYRRAIVYYPSEEQQGD